MSSLNINSLLPGLDRSGECCKPSKYKAPAQDVLTSQQSSYQFKSSQTTVSLSASGLSLSHQQSSISYSQSVTTSSRVSPADNMQQSPEKTAGNILSFIEKRLQTQAAQGATKEEMEKTLEQGKAGYLKGRDEAIEILKGYGFYNDDIAAGIEKTNTHMDAGLDKLRKAYMEPEADKTPEAPAKAVKPDAGEAKPALEPQDKKPAVINHAKAEQYAKFETAVSSSAINYQPSFFDKDEPENSLSSYIQQYRSDYQRDESMSFSLTTRDGDVVEINMMSVANARFDYNSSTMSGFQSEDFSAQTSAESRFSMQIKGDLDEKEMKAINELLTQVDELAQQFFSGDFDQAFQYAQDIGFDSSQLASFTLDLNLTEQQQVQASQASAYRDQAVQGVSLEPIRQSLKPIGQLVKPFASNMPLANFNLEEMLKPMLAGSQLEQERQGKPGFSERQQEFLEAFLNKGHARQLLQSA